MDFKYTKENKLLNIFGTDSEHDIQTVKKLIEEEKIPKDIETIVYQKNRTSSVVLMIRGKFLHNLLKDTPEPNAPSVVRPGIKSILQKINETNFRQSMYSGLLVYATATRRFLLFTPKHHNNDVYLLGDNPSSESETPVQIVCRVAREDIGFDDADPLEIDPAWLVPLKTLDIDGTMFHANLLMVEREFKPKLSARLLNSIWAQSEAMGELRLHPSVKSLFEQDRQLLRLTTDGEDVDYDNLIDQILHQQTEAESPPDE